MDALGITIFKGSSFACSPVLLSVLGRVYPSPTPLFLHSHIPLQGGKRSTFNSCAHGFCARGRGHFVCFFGMKCLDCLGTGGKLCALERLSVSANTEP